MPSGYLEDKQKIQVGDIEIEVIHTPGHAQGCVCFYMKEQNTLISGDALFQGSIGRLDLPTSDAEKMWPSLKKLEGLPPNTRVIPGHGEETTIGDESWLKNARAIFEH